MKITPWHLGHNGLQDSLFLANWISNKIKMKVTDEPWNDVHFSSYLIEEISKWTFAGLSSLYPEALGGGHTTQSVWKWSSSFTALITSTWKQTDSLSDLHAFYVKPLLQLMYAILQWQWKG